MDQKLEELISAGLPEDTPEGMLDEMKEDYLGGKARYVFPCYGCGASVTTQKAYWSSDNYVSDSVKEGISDGAQSVLGSLVGWVPLFGRYFRDRAERKVEAMREGEQENKMRKIQGQAFEEIKGQFNKCTRCGAWACSACFSEGLCGNCKTIVEAERQVEAAKKMT